ncbi:reverse transcriptase domain-containing protein, partial [Porticoccus sp.]
MSLLKDRKRERGPPILSNNGNFREWEIMMKGFLIQHQNAQDILDQDRPMAPGTSSDREDGTYASITAEEIEEQKEAAEVFEGKSRIIYSYLLEATESNNLAREMVLSHPFGDGWGLFRQLVKKFAPRNVSQLQAEQAKFNSLSIREGETGSEFAVRIEESASRLRGFGVEKSRDVDMLGILKEGLTDRRYKNLIMALFVMPELTWEYAILKISDFELSSHFAGPAARMPEVAAATPSRCTFCRSEKHTSSECWIGHPEKMPPAVKRKREARSHYEERKVKSRVREGEKQKSPDIICYNCGLRGHKAKTCRKPKQARAERSHSANAIVEYEGWIAMVELGDNDQNDAGGRSEVTEEKENKLTSAYSVTTPGTAESAGPMCLIDSGASEHILQVPREEFEDYEQTRGAVRLAKGSLRLPTLGVGSVGLLERCVHCPTISYNLISLSRLLQDGFKVDATASEMTITRDNTVIAIARLSRNLYWTELDNFKRTPEALNITSTRPVDEFKLLHRRFMHVNLPLIVSAASNNLIRGIQVDMKTYKKYTNERSTCTGCMKGKSSRNSFKKLATRKGSAIGEYISCDTISFSVETVNGEKYVQTYTDHASRRSWSFLMRNKCEALTCLKRLNEVVLPAYNVPKIGFYHSDGAKELIGKDVTTYLEEHGIRYDCSEAYTPEHNGVSERKFRTLKGMAASALFTAQLPKPFWGYAFLAATWVRNRLPTQTAWGIKTPYECWEKKTPNLHHLRTWGCKAFVHIDKGRRLKDFTEEADVGYLVGYTDTGYIVYDPLLKKQLPPSCNVKFDENIPLRGEEYWAELTQGELTAQPISITAPVAQYKYLEGTRHVDDEDHLTYETTRIVNQRGYVVGYRSLVLDSGERAQKEESQPIHARDIARLTAAEQVQQDAGTQEEVVPSKMLIDPHIMEETNTPAVRYDFVPSRAHPTTGGDSCNTGAQEESCKQTTSPVGREIRIRQKRKIMNVGTLGSDAAIAYARIPDEQTVWLAANSAATEDAHSDAPRTYREAMERADAREWQQATQKELTSLMDMAVYDIVPLPAGQRPLGSKLIFKIKRTTATAPPKYKARLVAQGFTQREGEDFGETYSPVARASSIRIVIALAASLRLHLHQMDVVVAFLNAPLDEVIYMKPPLGMDCPEGMVLRLKKSLYGLKQAPRNWNQDIDGFLVNNLKFRKCIIDPCIYVKRVDEQVLILVLYVDDMIIAGSHLPDIIDFKLQISNKYKMEDLGELEFILGMKVTKNADGSIDLNHERYATDVVTRFGLQESTCRAHTPMEQGLKLSKTELDDITSEQQDWINCFDYQAKVGCLMYLATCTRPDIAHAVSVVSRFMSTPTLSACHAITRILKYVNMTRKHGLRFRPGKAIIYGYSDASYGDCEDTGRSTAGAIFYLGTSPITWWSRLLKTVAQSTAEAEYMALCDASNEAIGLRSLLDELGYTQDGATVINEDNKACIDLANNPKYQRRTKHIKIRWHAIRQH